jgi:multiple sugar transport system substrate-binding protein
MADKGITAPDFNYDDFGASIREASTFGKQIVALPINQEGPLFYWRKDIFERCKIAEPKHLEDIPAAAAAIRSCDANQGAWAARGIRGVTPYALAAFIYNSGGSFAMPDGKPGLAQPNSVKGLALYANLLKDYGPPGALNHTFTQVIELLGQGRVAMTHESSNEFANIMRFPGRADDLGVKVLPPGRESGISKPVAIGWTVAISAHSKRQPAAWLFLQWATSPEVQSKLVQKGVAPPRASVFGGEAFKAWAAEIPVADGSDPGGPRHHRRRHAADRTRQGDPAGGCPGGRCRTREAAAIKRPDPRRPAGDGPSRNILRLPLDDGSGRHLLGRDDRLSTGLCGLARAQRRDARVRPALRRA